MISKDRLQQALTYLAETDEDAARAKTLVKGLEKSEKPTLAAQFLKVEGGSIAERDAIARTSTAYTNWRASYKAAVLDYERLETKRNTEILMVDVWRSLNANRRQGNI